MSSACVVPFGLFHARHVLLLPRRRQLFLSWILFWSASVVSRRVCCRVCRHAGCSVAGSVVTVTGSLFLSLWIFHCVSFSLCVCLASFPPSLQRDVVCSPVSLFMFIQHNILYPPPPPPPPSLSSLPCCNCRRWQIVLLSFSDLWSLSTTYTWPSFPSFALKGERHWFYTSSSIYWLRLVLLNL